MMSHSLAIYNTWFMTGVKSIVVLIITVILTVAMIVGLGNNHQV